MKEKIILDTDIGSDIDDSFALAYLLHASSAQLLGVTTVTGQARQRAQLCRILIGIAGRQVPVYAGEDHPLDNQEEHQPVCQMAGIAEEYPEDAPRSQESAVDFMLRAARQNPGEITLLSVAPFTNVAMALKKDPQFAGRLKRLVIMGGGFEQAKPEWNILCDRKAAEIMLKADFRQLAVFPCDLTNTVSTPASYLADNVHGEFREILLKMGNNWFARGMDHYHYHDPMAAVYCLHPELFEMQSGMMHTAPDGRSAWTSGSGSCLRAVRVQKQKFLEELYRVVNEAQS